MATQLFLRFLLLWLYPHQRHRRRHRHGLRGLTRPQVIGLGQETNPKPLQILLAVWHDIVDNPLTLGPELDWKLVGWAEVLYSFTWQAQLHLVMVMNLALFEGSSITILGRNVVDEEVKDMAVIGGSG
ncbi:dirigent protein 19-like [Cajanus cajan]|uniref:dirigent protein 19-like n=1 Tax=Cajanus cajan TaxID=3821 RepID=UPI00098D8B3F|nr:dirigent protein 19-like [Cajanus cajan]